MSQQSKKINIPKPAGGANAGGKKRKHDQIGSKHAKQPLKKLKISSILPKGSEEDAAPEYKPDYRKNSRIIKQELEAQKTRPKKETKWKKVDVDASKFLLKEGTVLLIFYIFN